MMFNPFKKTGANSDDPEDIQRLIGERTKYHHTRIMNGLDDQDGIWFGDVLAFYTALRLCILEVDRDIHKVAIAHPEIKKLMDIINKNIDETSSEFLEKRGTVRVQRRNDD